MENGAGREGGNMRYDVIFEGEIVRSSDHAPVPPEEFAGWIDTLTVELMKLRALTPLISGSAADATLDIRVGVETDDPVEATNVGDAQIHAAAHGAGLITAGWQFDWVSVRALGSRVPRDARELTPA
jgi:hypothetical protein